MAEKPTYEELEQRVKKLEKGPDIKGRFGDRLQILSLAIEQSSEGIAVVDMDGNLEYLNDAFAQMHGYSAEELVGKNLSVFHALHQIPSVEEANRAIKETGEFKGEIWHTRRDGTAFPTMMHNSIIRDNAGKPIGMMGTLRDISDIKQAEDALRESEEKYRLIAENAMDVIWVLDPENQTFKYVSPSVYHVLGFTDKEFLNRSLAQTVTPASLEYIQRTTPIRVERMLQGDSRSYTDRIDVIHKDGHIVPTEINIHFMKNKSTGLIEGTGEMRDITERKQAEERLQESLDEKVLLLGEIHHRVKNNLQVISSLMDLTRRRTLNEEAKMVLADARSKIYSMSLVHSQLYRSKSFTRIDMAVHARRLLDSMGQIYTNSYRRVRPRLECSKVFLSVTQAIPCALVMNELISNVYKHAYPEDATGECLISMEVMDGKTIHFRVRDNGVGIPEDIDIEGSETLGLKLIRNLVRKQLKGDVWFKNNNGMDIVAEFPVDHDDVLIH